jgi:ferredoxin
VSAGGVDRKLRVNPLLCTGFGYCAEIVPELISLDDWGYPIVDSSPIEADRLMQHARRAIAACPRLALMIEEVAKTRT